MKFLFILIMFAMFGAQVKAANLTNPDTPSEYFRKNAKARQDFIQSVQSSDLTAAEKEAYIALVSPENAQVTGDQVLELIDEETLKWFFSSRMDGVERIFDAATVSQEPMSLNHCLGYTLCVYISKATQMMTAYYNGRPIQGVTNVAISTARPGKYTPTGTFSIGELAGRSRVSGRYGGAALYYAMQLQGHIFLHATSQENYKDLGKPASAGCVRSTLQIAEYLNGLMRDVGGRRSNGHIQDSSQIRVVITPNTF